MLDICVEVGLILLLVVIQLLGVLTAVIDVAAPLIRKVAAFDSYPAGSFRCKGQHKPWRSKKEIPLTIRCDAVFA